LAIDDDGARAACTLIASLLRAGQTEHVAESVKKRHTRVEREFVGRIVNADIGFHVKFQDSLAAKCSAIGVPANLSPSKREKSSSELRGR
jgi:hypothetical protein